MKFKVEAALVVLAWPVIFVEPAMAYLDPGTGSIIIQGLIASIAGGIVVIRLYWAKLKSYFARAPEEQKSAETADDTE